MASLSEGFSSPSWRCLLIKSGVLGLIVVLIRHRCGHPDSGKSSKQSWQQTPLRREGVGLKSWWDHYNCFWQGSSPNMYMRENESSLSCQPLNWDIYDGGVEGSDGFLLSGMRKKWWFSSLDTLVSHEKNRLRERATSNFPLSKVFYSLLLMWSFTVATITEILYSCCPLEH